MKIEFSVATKVGLLSVVVPCYNAQRFLAQTLESAFAQTYGQVEIIVVDDGSTDRTAELIRSYGDRIKAIYGPNRGASAARARGTNIAAGEFIQYLDADDLLVPDAAERRIAALRRTGSDVAYSDWGKLIENSPNHFELTERVMGRIEDLDVDADVAQLNFWAPPAALTYRRSIVAAIGEWKDWLPIIQDARFLQDAFLAGGRFVHVAGIGAHYRVNGETSLSRRSGSAFVADVFRNGRDLQRVLETQGKMTTGMRRNFAQLYDYTARTLFFDDRGAFRDCMARLFALEPGFQATWPKTADLLARLVGFRVAALVLPWLSDRRQAFRRSRHSTFNRKATG